MTTESLIVELDGKIKGFQDALDRARKSSDGLGRSTKSTETKVKKFEISTLAAGVSVGLLATKMLALTESFTRTQNLLINVTTDTNNLADVTERLFEVSERSRSSYESTATLYARLARATKDLGLSQEDTLGITETLNKAFIAGGATTNEAAAATVQLSQALASGTLRGDEFNSVSEQAPAILDAIAFATGKARGELRELAADGAISSEVLVKSIKLYSDTIDNEFNKTTATFSDNLTLANNNLTETIGKMGVVSSVTGVAGRTIVGITENLDTFATFAGSALMAVALTNLKALNTILRANPYIAAGTAIAFLTTALSDYANTLADENLSEALENSVKSSIQQDIEDTTAKMQELSLEVQSQQALLEGGGINIDVSATQEKIDGLKQQIRELVFELQGLQEQQAGIDEIQATKTVDDGAGSVKLEEENEAIRALTQEQFDWEVELREQQIEKYAEYLETKRGLDEDYLNFRYDSERELIKFSSKALKTTTNDTEDAEDDKTKAISDGADAAVKIGRVAFGQNKAISQATAIVNTLQGVTKALSTKDYVGAALIAAAGFAQVSQIASTEPGSSVGGSAGIPTAPPQDDFEPETTGLEVSAVTEGEGNTIQTVRIDNDNLDDLSTAIARQLKSA